MTIAIDAVTGRPRSLVVNDDGELLVSGVGGGGGGGGDASAANQDEQTALLTTIDADTGSMDTKLSTVIGHLDGVEATLTAIDGRVDTLESLIGTTNSTLTTIDGRVDTLESLIGTTNSTLSTIDGRVDGLEASLSSVDTKLTQLGKSGGREYETVAVSQTDQVLGASGAVGDYIEGLICVVATAATSQVQIKDGNGSAITVLPNSVGAGVGTYYVPLGLTSVNGTSAGWKVTTAAGVTVIALGDFT